MPKVPKDNNILQNQSPDEEFSVTDFFSDEALSPWVAQYAQLILQQAGLTDLDTDFKLQIMDRLTEQIQQQLGMIIMDALDDKGLEALIDFASTHPEAKASEWQEWFAKHIPDFEKRAEVGLTEFGQKFIAAVMDERERYRQKSHDNLAG